MYIPKHFSRTHVSSLGILTYILYWPRKPLSARRKPVGPRTSLPLFLQVLIPFLIA